MFAFRIQSTELYDKGCQADLGGAEGAGGLGAVGSEEDRDAMETQQSSSLLKKTPDKRRNHRRCLIETLNRSRMLVYLHPP